MNTLFEDIIRRWIRAFDEFGRVEEARSLVRTTKYATGYRYELENYDLVHFPAGGELVDQLPPDEVTPYEFGFDSSGLPVFDRNWSPHSDYEVRGLYTYSDQRVEHIAFDVITGTPVSIETMQFANAGKIAFQRLSLNGGGRWLQRKAPDEMMAWAQNDDYSIISEVKEFIYEGDRIKGAHCFAVMPGLGKYTYEEEYVYDKNGALDEIANVYVDGRREVSYARLEDGMDLDTLVESLSVRMANAIINALLEDGVQEALAQLELNYRSTELYLPYVTYKTLADRDRIVDSHKGAADFEAMFSMSYDHVLHIEPGEMQRPLRQLDQLLAEMEDWSAGSRMLLKAAHILTTGKLNGKVPVSDDFVAYAVNWEGDTDRFAEVLRECGLAEDIIDDWTARGWLP